MERMSAEAGLEVGVGRPTFPMAAAGGPLFSL